MDLHPYINIFKILCSLTNFNGNNQLYYVQLLLLKAYCILNACLLSKLISFSFNNHYPHCTSDELQARRSWAVQCRVAGKGNSLSPLGTWQTCSSTNTITPSSAWHNHGLQCLCRLSCSLREHWARWQTQMPRWVPATNGRCPIPPTPKPF